ncbi:Phosphate carrier protein mitochondrial [Trichostrongylus colubriformis]|uniref:Phosphate carrier protein, mitochondrial n=1 Tax=Trichostrongylus colubriformis TaxID=6319 RepID=A0AAN8J125_TRICO
MTSETQEKFIPYFVRAGTPAYRGGVAGCFFVILMWIILYLWGVTQLVDGILDWLSYGRSSAVVQIGVAIATTTISTVVADAVEFGTLKYYSLCAFGGVLSCGITHTAIVPLDLVKCRIQVNPEKYKNIVTGFRTTVAEEGARALVKGWAPTAIGYSLQGLGKFGFYEIFKHMYAEMLGEENAYLYRTSLYLAASASAEFFADIMLAPMEATKVRVQTSPGAPPTLRGCAPMIYRTEGLAGFYKGIVPLWLRQIPYTMMKFACFERTVEMLYKYVVPKPRSQCSKPEQLVVTFVAGYIAGVFCAIVSHPADTVVSKLNQDSGSGIGGIIKKLGFAGLWKGLFPRIIMIGTLTALQWFIYDSVKVALHLPRPPPPSMPESLRLKLEAAGKLHNH